MSFLVAQVVRAPRSAYEQSQVLDLTISSYQSRIPSTLSAVPVNTIWRQKERQTEAKC